MKRMHKVLWLIVIIIAIGIVAVATRTPHETSSADRAVAPPAGQSPGQAADTTAAVP
jgi:hypothetical protein